MSRKSKILVPSTLLVAVLGVAGCAKPPEEAIAAARAAEQSAEAAEAGQYAPDAVNAVNEARVALDAEIAAQAERLSIRRSYDRATELATAYRTAAEKATSEATAAKEQIRVDVESRLAAARTSLEEVRSMLAAAPVGKGSRADLAALRTDLDVASAGLDEVATAVSSGHYIDARTRLDAAVEVIERVRSDLDGARRLSRS